MVEVAKTELTSAVWGQFTIVIYGETMRLAAAAQDIQRHHIQWKVVAAKILLEKDWNLKVTVMEVLRDK